MQYTFMTLLPYVSSFARHLIILLQHR